MTSFETRQELFREILRSAGEARLAVSGTSMLPAIWSGDVITVQHCEAAGLRPGEVVFYMRGEGLVAHRVVANSGGRLIARGDSLPDCDRPVSAADILGRVVAVERNGRWISPAQSNWQRCVACILRHSHFCARVLLFLHRRLHGAPDREMAWASR